MSNIEKIRQEIERRKKICEGIFERESDTYYQGKAVAYGELLPFIDSLPGEIPPYCTGFKGDPDPPGISDLEQAAENIYKVPFGTRAEDFIAGAEWQANQLLKGSPLPEDTVLFQKGVEEGRRLEKDEHRLTWQDMAKIDAIILDVNNEFAVDYSKEIDRQKFYEEVLKRFKDAKE